MTRRPLVPGPVLHPRSPVGWHGRLTGTARRTSCRRAVSSARQARRVFWPLALVAVSLVCAFLFGLALAPGHTTTPLASRSGAPSSGTQEASGSSDQPSRVIQEAGRSVVSIDVASTSFVSDPAGEAALPGVGKGAGFIIDDQGHAITNYHVVADMDDLDLTLFDGTVVLGRVVGRDPTSDLALIALEGRPTAAVPARLGNSSSTQVGDTVFAIGDPYGFQRSVSVGIVSGLGRLVLGPDGRMMPAMIQVDASISPGNSGGPLLNSRGEVIGVVAAKLTNGTLFGFAIPIERVRRVVPDLIASGRVTYSWLGLSGTSVPASLARTLDQSARRGVLVQRVAVGGPAHEGGLRGPRGLRLISADGRGDSVVPEGGDIIVAVDGRPIAGPCDLTEYLIDRKRPGDRIRLGAVRDGAAWSLEVVLGEWPASDPRAEPAGSASPARDDW
jgi:S1-C subfamily serine protease